ncbi:unnamed protein product [Didymodactylos carnosus]|uniref:Uncharacterized protein n=1 Tax=Didymodactylos carnosus TaxID=1234261 RepID=A0A814RUL7_9BILA|nr:unnamed protein product [Didymodactylos carnosus]CAF1567213.1 unnamed protein product [Didymodactylos carnosus]CAF3900448.1 unnamed protein product [Didymodactylos carnosus]CAF4360574.1 unnamed protein product [Didymodactylos carnosus]
MKRLLNQLLDDLSLTTKTRSVSLCGINLHFRGATELVEKCSVDAEVISKESKDDMCERKLDAALVYCIRAGALPLPFPVMVMVRPLP